jgi:L-ascorbate metabolism protein UlaG (beta-lactamase superfamily)
MRVEELVESIFASVQWDCWRFMLPAKPLLKLDVAVVSHGHADHWHPNFQQKDVVLVPAEVAVPSQFNNLSNIIRVSSDESLGSIRFMKVGWQSLATFIRKRISQPHAFWWLVRAGSARVLFVGDADLEDVALLERFTDKMFEQGLPLHGVLLPSFGGVAGHGAGGARELSAALGEFARELRGRYDVKIGALPHPVNADWADYAAVRL